MIEPSIPPEVERIDVDDAGMENFKTESEFTGLAVSLMVEAASYACIAASTLGHSKTWDRDKAAVGGNMVRLYKLLDAFLDQTCQRREEMSSIVARLIFETAVNIRFLIQHFSKELVDEYVAYSLRHERRQRDQVLTNISARNGLVLPIEDRILKSISRSERASGMLLDSTDPKDTRPWGGKNIFGRTRDVGLEPLYRAAFGGMSHNIHGNWQELYGNHLEWDEEKGFTPKLKWRTPRPQMLTSLALVVAETSAIYFTFMGGEEVGQYFERLLTDLTERVLKLVHAHEGYLGGKQWPEI